MKREENQTVEYKEAWHEKYLEWICGYANAKGGTLYIGIEDGTKKPVGVKNTNKLMEDIPNSIRNTMGIVADVSLLKKQGKDVIRIKVNASSFPVSYQGRFHYRTGAVKMMLTGPALTQFLMEKSAAVLLVIGSVHNASSHVESIPASAEHARMADRRLVGH